MLRILIILAVMCILLALVVAMFVLHWARNRFVDVERQDQRQRIDEERQAMLHAVLGSDLRKPFGIANGLDDLMLIDDLQ